MEVARLFFCTVFPQDTERSGRRFERDKYLRFFLAKFHRLCVRPYKAFVSCLQRSLLKTFSAVAHLIKAREMAPGRVRTHGRPIPGNETIHKLILTAAWSVLISKRRPWRLVTHVLWERAECEGTFGGRKSLALIKTSIHQANPLEFARPSLAFSPFAPRRSRFWFVCMSFLVASIGVDFNSPPVFLQPPRQA